MTFSANGEYLVSGHDEGVRVWRVEDGKDIVSLFLRTTTGSRPGRGRVTEG